MAHCRLSVGTSNRVQEVFLVVECFVGIAEARPGCNIFVGSPLVRNYICTWCYVSLYDRVQSCLISS